MTETKIIYHCPNGCNAPLTSDFEVEQTWRVDIDGEPIEPDSPGEISRSLTQPKCSKCGSEAVEYPCKTIPIFDSCGQPVSTAYMPAKEYRIVFLRHGLSTSLLDIVRRNGADCVIDEGKVYELTQDGLVPRNELPGQISLF